jgi:serine phosphatase RsbU (regulator of sigma subunit)
VTGVDLAGLVRDLATAEPGATVGVLDRHLGVLPWFAGSRLLLTDYGDRLLVDTAGPTRPLRPGELATDSFRSCHVRVGGAGHDTVVVVPLRVRADCIGVLEFDATAVPPDDELTALEAVGYIMGNVLAAAKHQLEHFQRVRRVQPMSLSAEIQWDLLSARSEAGGGYVAAGWLEPAYDVGGDTFDLAGDVGALWVSSIDAMGHGLHSGVVSGVSLSAVRNARRNGGGVADQAAAVNEALLRLWEGERYATLLLLRVDTATGEVDAVNAGHPTARRVRAGTVEPVRLDVDVPPGLTGTASYHTQRFSLAPGDRLVVMSDGVAAAAVDGGMPYGPTRVDQDLLTFAPNNPVETVRSLAWNVLRHSDQRLRDDATIVCLDWEGGHGR